MQQPNINISNNSLYTREECPSCRTVFTSGFDPNGIRNCPSCKQRFQSCQKKNLENKYRGSNNVYYKDGCPAIMSDGRFITYYNSTNELTEMMRKLNGIESPNEFRTFMQKYGDQFLNAERNHIIKENTCSPQTACSEGWYKLWTQNGGDWSNFENGPVAYNQY
jgi:ribosomal protein L37AE/L43A